MGEDARVVAHEVDVAIVGAGGAGLSLLHQIALRGPARLRVALVDPVRRLRDRPDDRTWCFWDDGTSDVDEALARSWSRVRVVAPGSHLELDLAPMRYAMLRSSDYYGLVARETGALDVAHLEASATSLDDDGERVVVRTPAGDVTARWVFDSRPAQPRRPGVTTLLQHFRGAVVRTGTDAFDADLPTLMDFTTPQPARGLSFGYCLPLDARTALVEYTEFSPAVLDDEGYTAALSHYLAAVLGPVPHEVTHVEQGVIPMTDGVFARRAGPRAFRLGTAGGATRASTGYTFAAMQRQARSVALALRGARDPLPPRAYPRRHALMDAAMLRGLDAGHLDGPAFFARLFERNPPQRVLAFLDGSTSLADELAVMRTAPRRAMVRSGAEVL
ncbi:MAG TPA: lycopene cyclase family protein, partial [Actinomycetales bacterium]|nr:lycopene cyclase family protein [Actinomycetales bacterium]